MKLGDDVGPRMIYFKGILFLFLLCVSSALILVKNFSWEVSFLLAVLIWSSARLYYFMFYVIEKYVDPNYKFSGVCSFVIYLLGRKGES